MLLPDRGTIRPLPRGTSLVPTHPTGKRSFGLSRSKHERGQSVVEFALVLPLMVLVLLAVIDFARIYTTMMSVESAAREAADFGTTLGAQHWQAGAPTNATVQEMRKRACVAASDLPDYADPESPNDPAAGNCTNPGVSDPDWYCMTVPETGICGPPDPSCADPLRPEPCTVTVTLSYEFHLLAPFNIQFFDRQIGLPSTLTFTRDSTYAMTDIDLSVP
jgi:hypothetical protein